MEKKKNEDQRVERKMPLFYLLGLNIALLFTILAFEWKTEPAPIKFDTEYGTIFEPPIDIPITHINPPPPPKVIVQPEIKEVKEDPIQEPLKVIFEVPEEEPVPDSIFEPMDDEPVDDAPVTFAQHMPSFPGGYEAFYKFLSKKIKYPAQARRMGIEGRVYVSFIVEKDGSLGQISVVKGMGAGLDEESLRVMNQVPKWNPGKQGHRPVRVKMTIPINFKLAR